jgi:cell division septation protein DedD
MKGAGETGGSSGYASGRALLISVVIVFSSLTFVLGYFVGKNDPGRRSEIFSATRDLQARAGTGNDAGHTVGPAVAETTPPQVMPHIAQPDPVAKPEIPAVPPVDSQKPPAGSAGAQKPTQPPATHEVLPSSKEDAPPASSAGRKGKAIYSVQVGALHDRAMAEKIRKRYEKQGYKTYLFVTKNKKHEKIYKIRVGEFEKRDDAEILSGKMKKTEGLYTFVTTKDN